MYLCKTIKNKVPRQPRSSCDLSGYTNHLPLIETRRQQQSRSVCDDNTTSFQTLSRMVSRFHHVGPTGKPHKLVFCAEQTSRKTSLQTTKSNVCDGLPPQDNAFGLLGVERTFVTIDARPSCPIYVSSAFAVFNNNGGIFRYPTSFSDLKPPTSGVGDSPSENKLNECSSIRWSKPRATKRYNSKLRHGRRMHFSVRFSGQARVLVCYPSSISHGSRLSYSDDKISLTAKRIDEQHVGPQQESLIGTLNRYKATLISIPANRIAERLLKDIRQPMIVFAILRAPQLGAVPEFLANLMFYLISKFMYFANEVNFGTTVLRKPQNPLQTSKGSQKSHSDSTNYTVLGVVDHGITHRASAPTDTDRVNTPKTLSVRESLVSSHGMTLTTASCETETGPGYGQQMHYMVVSRMYPRECLFAAPLNLLCKSDELDENKAYFYAIRSNTGASTPRIKYQNDPMQLFPVNVSVGYLQGSLLECAHRLFSMVFMRLLAYFNQRKDLFTRPDGEVSVKTAMTGKVSWADGGGAQLSPQQNALGHMTRDESGQSTDDTTTHRSKAAHPGRAAVYSGGSTEESQRLRDEFSVTLFKFGSVLEETIHALQGVFNLQEPDFIPDEDYVIDPSRDYLMLPHVTKLLKVWGERLFTIWRLRDLRAPSYALPAGMDSRASIVDIDLADIQWSCGHCDELPMVCSQQLARTVGSKIRVLCLDQQIDAVMELLNPSRSTECGPLDEVDYWRHRCKVLTAIAEALRSKKSQWVINAWAVLNPEAPPYNRGAEIKAQMLEAKDNSRFLLLVERHFKNVQFGSTFEIVTDTIPAMVQSLRLIWTISRGYNKDERMGPLLQRIAWALCDRVICVLEVSHLFSQSIRTILREVRAAIRMLTTFENTYLLERQRVEATSQDNRWEFDRKSLFGDIHYMKRILTDIYDMAKCANEFYHMFGPELKNITGDNKTLSEILRLVDQLFTAMKSQELPCPFLQKNEKMWLKVKAEFEDNASMIDAKAKNFINDYFAHIRGPTSAFDLLEKFKSVKARAAITCLLKDKYRDVLRSFGNELVKVESKFKESRDAPAVAHYLPPTAGSISWSRLILLTVKASILRFIQSQPDILEEDEGKAVKARYISLAEELRKYERGRHRSWEAEVNATVSLRLSQPVLFKHTNQIPYDQVWLFTLIPDMSSLNSVRLLLITCQVFVKSLATSKRYFRVTRNTRTSEKAKQSRSWVAIRDDHKTADGIACEENLVDLEHADDIVLIFEEEEKAQGSLDELTKVIPSFGMHFAPTNLRSCSWTCSH
ncbi:dynein-1-alpha heavy chain flagellar inner arm I1 complex [Clonorchis sinensis]|uniref:Dynein-1-alpha heavy chain flagellar inner arm I1 complex n=1 Tax=Clonorchis sinensis TaxID=79923 RepID=G7Y7X1_CLOSI|nr:dynein-1-alpha heavy chain flagellar inner arm I1 complex [Clonorchis sinensis]